MWQLWYHQAGTEKFRSDDKLYRHITNIQEKIDELHLGEYDMKASMVDAYNFCLDHIGHDRSLLHRPATDAQSEPAALDFKIPLFNLVTSKYADMQKLLNHIYMNYIGNM